MSFFKDFKEDLSQAVNELVPGEISHCQLRCFIILYLSEIGRAHV